MDFSRRLRFLLEERGITQKHLANVLRIPVSTLGGYFQGTSEPDFQTLILIAEYFDVTTDYLLGIPGVNTYDSDENDLLRIYRCLSPEQRALYLEQGKAFIKINTKRKNRS
ncbi:MAG: helix-turn-helix domain-containing protein [Clostridiales bacterium]|nr:helix-turn-helix domain-containing protein [Clostridiales bacterium]